MGWDGIHTHTRERPVARCETILAITVWALAVHRDNSSSYSTAHLPCEMRARGAARHHHMIITMNGTGCLRRRQPNRQTNKQTIPARHEARA
jgi:hypothetical protein